MRRLQIIMLLTDLELEDLDELGVERRASAAGSQLHRAPRSVAVDGPNNYDRTEGAIGEYPFQEWSGLPMRRIMGPDGGFDFMMPNGETLDVKYTRHEYGRFLPRYDEGLRADLGVLAIRIKGDRHLVKLHGWITREMWLEAEQRFSRTFDDDIGRQAFYPRGIMLCMSELVSRTELILPVRWEERRNEFRRAS